MTGSGGSGTYWWETDDSTIVSVKGQAYIKSNLPGKTKLILRDHKNLNNYAEIPVEIVPVASLQWF